jgi:hypothetical protein
MHNYLISRCDRPGGQRRPSPVRLLTVATVGPITAQNSVRGVAAGGGASLVWAYDYVHYQLVVGRPADNIVTLFRPFSPVFLPVVLRQAS